MLALKINSGRGFFAGCNLQDGTKTFERDADKLAVRAGRTEGMVLQHHGRLDGLSQRREALESFGSMAKKTSLNCLCGFYSNVLILKLMG